MYGIDIAKDRFDEQDKQILEHVLKQDWNPKKCLILGGGKGRIGVVLALLGFEVTCMDIGDYGQYYKQVNDSLNFSKPITFIQKDMATLKPGDYKDDFSLVIIQRALHYLAYDKQIDLLDTLPGYMFKQGYLYLAVSCVDSALGEGYEGVGVPIEQRHHVLSNEMQERFSLTAPVCLHSLSEFKTLMKGTHFKKRKLYQTSFGNIKGLYQL